MQMINKMNMIYTYNTHTPNSLKIKKGLHATNATNTTNTTNNPPKSNQLNTILNKNNKSGITRGLNMSAIIHAPKTGCSACGS